MTGTQKRRYPKSWVHSDAAGNRKATSLPEPVGLLGDVRKATGEDLLATEFSSE
jgi:hypothetical protein